eukprot:6179918-Pleurochrysis_carterae.AAC.1
MLPWKSTSQRGPKCVPRDRHPVECMCAISIYAISHGQAYWGWGDTVCRLVFRVEVKKRVPVGHLRKKQRKRLNYCKSKSSSTACAC